VTGLVNQELLLQYEYLITAKPHPAGASAEEAPAVGRAEVDTR
jgi:hypothetical protein